MSNKSDDAVCPVGFGGKNPMETLSKASCSSDELQQKQQQTQTQTQQTQQKPSSQGNTGIWNVESGQHFTVDNIEKTDGLSNRALKSSIPKGGVENKDETWTYPSPQRFYNAMKKKGWEANPSDISTVVAIHNTVNEKCWKEVMTYEKLLHCDECEAPKLTKFRGRPTDYSPKARFFNMLGYALPFDRHDWIVDRCGKQVRYVIDFYQGPPPVNSNNTNNKSGIEPTSIYLDVRPAVSFTGMWDRMRMKYFEFFRADKIKEIKNPSTTQQH